MAGLGVLLSVPITAGLVGGRSGLAWSAHLVTGGLLCVGLGLRARLPDTTGGVVGLVASAWGRLGGQTVTALYLAGFIVGQAAIVLTAGQFAAYVVDRPGATGVVVGTAITTVVVAATVAATVHAVPAAARHWRIAAAWPVGLALAADPALLRGSGLLPATDVRQFWPAVFLLLFAGVGWEQSAKLAHRVRDTRELVRAVALAVAVISGGGYLLAATTASSVGRDATTPWPAAGSAALAVAVATLLATFCITNIHTAAGFVRALTRRHPARQLGQVAVVATPILVILVAATHADWRPHELLAGPAVAVWFIYMLALVSGLWGSGPGLKLALIAPSVLLLLTAAAAAWSVMGGDP